MPVHLHHIEPDDRIHTRMARPNMQAKKQNFKNKFVKEITRGDENLIDAY